MLYKYDLILNKQFTIKWKTKYTTSSEQFNNLKIIEVKRWIPLTQIYMTTDSSLASGISIKMDWSYTSFMDCPIVPFLWNDAAIASVFHVWVKYWSSHRTEWAVVCFKDHRVLYITKSSSFTYLKCWNYQETV